MSASPVPCGSDAKPGRRAARLASRCGRFGVALLVATAMGCAAAADEEPAAPQVHRIMVQGFVFLPAEVEVSPGDTVVWVNQDVVPHTATSPDGLWDTGSIAGGAEGKLVVTDEMVGEYLCTFHPSMRAVLRLR